MKIIGFSPKKMKVWNQVFKEEGWVGSDFQMDGDPFELMYMYVKPEYRKKGLGAKLFKRAEDFARERKVNEIYAYVSDRASDALFFYKKMQAEIIQDFSDDEATSAFLRWKLN